MLQPNDEILGNNTIALNVSGVAEEAKQEDEARRAITWEKIKPIPNPLKSVDEFDFNSLPATFIPWIKDISERMQCPPDYTAIGVMITLSSVIGRRVGINPKKYDTSWLVVCNLWGFAVGRPSAMKTPALAEVLKPLKRLEAEEKKRYEELLDEYSVDVELLKLTGEQIQKDAKAAIKAKNTAKAREILKQAKVEEGEAPKRKRYIIYDATIEKLGELLNQNPNGLLLFRDEISGWLKTIDREDRANDREFWIESFEGKGSYTYDRIGRGTLDIEAITTSILGGIQPAKLQPYIMSNLAGGKNDDGFIQRLQLAVYPDQQKKWAYVDREPDKDAKEKVFNIYDAIANKIIFPEPKEGEEIPAIHFDEEAQGFFIEWLTELETELRSNQLHPVMESHLTKYRSLIPSLALVIHIADLAEHEQFNLIPVGKDALIKAVHWSGYLRTHAERIYGIGLNSENTAARLIIQKIEEGKLAGGFKARDIKQNGWSGLTGNEFVQNALLLLEDCHYLSSEKIEGSNRPSVIYHINPALKKHKNA